MYFERGREVRLPLEYSVSCSPFAPATLIQPWFTWGLFAVWVASIFLVVRLRGSGALARYFLFSAVGVGAIACAVVAMWMDRSTGIALEAALVVVPLLLVVWAIYTGVMVAAFVQLAAVFTEWANGCIGRIGKGSHGIAVGPEPK
ncbi:MAG: hypothetical protein WDZ59_14515 [Pirellulales bacterium]